MSPHSADVAGSGPAAWVMWVLIGLLGLAGVGIGLIVLGFVPGHSRSADAFYDLPEVQVHVALLLAQVAFWFIAAPLLVIWRRELKNRWNVNSGFVHPLVAAGSLGALIFVPMLLGRGQSALPPGSYTARFLFLYPVGLVVIVPALMVLDTIDAACRDNTPGLETVGYVEEYFVMRSALQRVLVVMGVAVSLLVVATGAYFNALQAWKDAGNTIVVPPQSALLVYGALFVAVLVAMFLPVFNAVRLRGAMIVEKQAQLVPAHDKELVDKLKARYAVRTQLGLDDNTREVFERSVLVLSPLLSAALTTFIGK